MSDSGTSDSVTLDTDDGVGSQGDDSVGVIVDSNSYRDSSSGLILDERMDILETLEGVRVNDGVSVVG